MTQTIESGNLHCLCCRATECGRIAYVLYPMDILAGWIEPAARQYDTDIVVITGMDWQNVFSPWPAKGVPDGTPDFKGDSPEFLKMLTSTLIPDIEIRMGITAAAERTLVGVSMSGLFALWQWVLCGTFANIASLSGSFWFDGFLDWFKSREIPAGKGKAYFLLGDKESKSRIKAFDSVADNTLQIVALLTDAGITTQFQTVPGNHYSDPILRLDRAFTALFPR